MQVGCRCRSARGPCTLHTPTAWPIFQIGAPSGSWACSCRRDAETRDSAVMQLSVVPRNRCTERDSPRLRRHAVPRPGRRQHLHDDTTQACVGAARECSRRGTAISAAASVCRCARLSPTSAKGSVTCCGPFHVQPSIAIDHRAFVAHAAARHHETEQPCRLHIDVCQAHAAGLRFTGSETLVPRTRRRACIDAVRGACTAAIFPVHGAQNWPWRNIRSAAAVVQGSHSQRPP